MDDRAASQTAAGKAGGRVLAAAQPPRAATLAAADRLKAIGLMCLAVAFFSALDTSAKYLVTQAHLPVVQIVWSRFLGADPAHVWLRETIRSIGVELGRPPRKPRRTR